MFAMAYEDPLAIAVANNNTALLIILLRRRTFPVTQSKALMLAIFWNFYDIVEILLTHVPDMQYQTGELLVKSIETKNICLVALLLKHNVNRNDGNVLLTALHTSNLDMIELLLQNGFDPSDIIIPAINTKLYDVVDMLLRYMTPLQKQKHMLLCHAVRTRSHLLVTLLLSHTVSIEHGDPLHEAVIGKDIELMNLLLQSGVDPCKSNALQTAVSMNKLCMVVLLLENMPSIRTQKGNILCKAIKNKNRDIIFLLLKHSVNLKDGDPLSVAVLENNIEMVTLLLYNGADPRKSNALVTAISLNLFNIVVLLVENTLDISHVKGELLVNAIYTNNTDLVTFLLDCEVDYSDGDPLSAAILVKNMEIMALLFRRGFTAKPHHAFCKKGIKIEKN